MWRRVVKIKKKTAVSLLTISLLGVGITYASVDAGEAISSWYQNQFLKSSNEIGYATGNKMVSSFGQIYKEINKIGDSNGEKINEIQINTTSDTAENIKKYNEQYIEQLKATTDTLKQQNSKNMENYTEEKKAKAIEQVTQDTEDILKELLSKQN
jgi:hypothetical protein